MRANLLGGRRNLGGELGRRDEDEPGRRGDHHVDPSETRPRHASEEGHEGWPDLAERPATSGAQAATCCRHQARSQGG